jgi:molybdopterin-guanine dinucleotide biosynthesis protein A
LRVVTFDGIVLAGGGARRLGGADKAALDVGGLSLIDRVLSALDGARAIFVVGPRRATERRVTWVREDPPGGGPVAALAAAWGLVTANVVVVLAVDLPFVEAATVARLVTAAGSADGAVLTDDAGRDQPLAAAYRSASLKAALAALGPPDHASVSRLLGGLTLARVADGRAARDCDTWTQVAAARRGSRR